MPAPHPTGELQRALALWHSNEWLNIHHGSAPLKMRARRFVKTLFLLHPSHYISDMPDPYSRVSTLHLIHSAPNDSTDSNMDITVPLFSVTFYKVIYQTPAYLHYLTLRLPPFSHYLIIQTEKRICFHSLNHIPPLSNSHNPFFFSKFCVFLHHADRDNSEQTYCDKRVRRTFMTNVNNGTSAPQKVTAAGQYSSHIFIFILCIEWAHEWWWLWHMCIIWFSMRNFLGQMWNGGVGAGTDPALSAPLYLQWHSGEAAPDSGGHYESLGSPVWRWMMQLKICDIILSTIVSLISSLPPSLIDLQYIHRQNATCLE